MAYLNTVIYFFVGTLLLCEQVSASDLQKKKKNISVKI